MCKDYKEDIAQLDTILSNQTKLIVHAFPILAKPIISTVVDS